jgi:hypothetical protein
MSGQDYPSEARDALFEAIASALASEPSSLSTIQIRFDGPPSHVGGRFIEVEDENCKSISIGEWVQVGDDWLLKIPGVRR